MPLSRVARTAHASACTPRSVPTRNHTRTFQWTRVDADGTSDPMDTRQEPVHTGRGTMIWSRRHWRRAPVADARSERQEDARRREPIP